jgi:PKD-like domain/Secretion system C-terminal sorting domain
LQLFRLLIKYSSFTVFLLVLSFQLSGQKANLLFVVKAHASPDTICQGQYTQLSVSLTGGTGPFTYFWYPGATLSDPAIQNPIATPLVNTMYTVVVTDQTQSIADSIMVYVETIPLPPSPIMGPSEVCGDSAYNYSVIDVEDATSYSWTVPAGATILTGQNTNLIDLKWGRYSGTVSVIIGNKCGTSVPSVLAVSVMPAPNATSAIHGPSHICQSDTGSYQADTILNASSYVWNVPADATILNGAGTTSVMVKWGISAGDISVSGKNGCGTGPPLIKPVGVDSLPGTPGIIQGADTVCTGSNNYEYFISPVPYATSYGWTLPQGAIINSGQHTNRISVQFGNKAQTGPVTAFGINSCGNGQASIKQVIVKKCSGIIENNFSSLITLSPNPVSGTLYINSKGRENHFEITVIDQLGKTLYNASPEWQGGDFTLEIDVSRFPKGMMFLRLFNENGSFTSKFIVR